MVLRGHPNTAVQAQQAIRWPTALLVTGAVAAAVVPTPAAGVERLYSTGPYLVVQRALTSASNAAGFSLLDVFAAAVIVFWVLALARDVSRRPGWFRIAGPLVWRTVAMAAALYLAFLMLWGLNYRRVPLTEKLQFDPAAATPGSARAMTATAIDRLNRLFDAGHATEPAASLPAAFASVQGDLGAARPAVPGRPKRTLADWYFRRAAVDGMTDPFFLETLVAGDLLPVERPFVVAHEWSHLAGYADESEANFLGWVICLKGGDASAYSGWLFLYSELIGAVDIRDRRDLPELDAGPRADLRAISDRLRRNVSPALSTAGWLVYDRYLKANRVEAGAASYGQVVRLALGARFGDGWTPLLRAR